MPELSLTLTELVFAGLALFLAGSVKGVLGIGTPLVGVPAMTLLTDPATAAASIAIPSLLANVVQLRDGGNGENGERDALLAEAALHIARYKLPKAFRFVPAIQRAANGKPDYGWAHEAGKEAS